MYTKKAIAKILVRRDGISYEEALDIIEECQEAINDLVSAGAYYEVEDVLAGDLGLEMDYIWAFI